MSRLLVNAPTAFLVTELSGQIVRPDASLEQAIVRSEQPFSAIHRETIAMESNFKWDTSPQGILVPSGVNLVRKVA